VFGDQILLQIPPALGRPHAGADPLLAHRQDLCPDAQRPRDLSLGCGPGAALGDELLPVQAGGQIAI
jgi:hypothetical protein